MSGLATDPGHDGASGISLTVVLADAAATHASAYRGHLRRSGAQEQQTSHLYVHRTRGEDARQLWLGNIVEACDSGRLRLIRQGSTLYALIAEGDSSHFRVVSKEQVAADSSILIGIRLRVITDSGRADVVWKNMTIRADRLSGPAAEDTVEQLNALNEQRTRLSQRFTHDFSLRPPAAADFVDIGSAEQWKKTDGGFRVVSAGSEAWLTEGFRVQKKIVGDFDILTQFEILDLPTPTARLSSVYLQLQLRDDQQSRPTLVFHKNESGETTIVAELWVQSSSGGIEYRTLSKVKVESVSGLRLARRGGELFYVVTSRKFDRDHVIAKTAIAAVPILPGDAAFHVHAGGTGLQARVLSRLIDIRATETGEALPAP